MMQPGAHKFHVSGAGCTSPSGEGPRGKRGSHPNGAGLADDEVVAMAAMSDDELDSKMAVLQRQFTDQLMASLKHLGAP